jgi:hypothetical protein
MHHWESKGLGRAPFVFDRYEKRPKHSPASCDDCGRSLLHLFWVADTHGMAAIKAAKLANLDERIAAAQARFVADPHFLTDKPSYWRRYDGKPGNQTLREKVEFLFANGGVKGKTDACEIVESHG